MAGGVWIGVARDSYLRYVDSEEYGSGNFEAFLHAELDAQGVRDLDKCRGTAQKTAAKRANQAFILEQRAEMRARLVQVAIAGNLKYSEAALAGFAQREASLSIDDDDDDVQIAGSAE